MSGDIRHHGVEGWQCPKCNSTDLRVVVETWTSLTQHGRGDFQTEADIEAAHEWGENSAMECVSCGFNEKSSEFEAVDVAGEHTPDTEGAARALAVELLNRRTAELDRALQALEACKGMVEWARDNGAHFGATSALLKMVEAAIENDRRKGERRVSGSTHPFWPARSGTYRRKDSE